MNLAILSPEIQAFIDNSLEANFSKIALMKNPFPEVPWNEILNQIAAKKKAKEKLPTWFHQKSIIYPNKLSIEQTSSELTAQYKSELVSGDTLIDLTGGFGIDDYYFSKKINKVIHCEIKKDLHKLVEHNLSSLNANNIQFLNGDSSLILEQLNQNFDWIYIDPSRRNDIKGKVFMLKDCLPNVPKNLNFYFHFSNNILIKTAPILDISAGLAELNNIKELHIVAVNNEVKEMLWLLQKDYTNDPTIKTINLKNESNEIFDFHYNEITNPPTQYSLPETYLYEPNAAILKSGAFDLVGKSFNVKKLHQHSHLYTSTAQKDFPGRQFKINFVLDFNKNEMKSQIQNTKANVTTRNFPEKVEDLRKKWKIKDGGDVYLFFTTNRNNAKIVIVCSKL